MFSPQIALVAILSLAASLGIGFYSGQDWATTKAEAQRMQDLVDYNNNLHEKLKLNEELSNALSIAEGRVITKTVEVIKHVPSVTTGTTPCLGPAAISLLQPGSGQGVRPPTSEPAAEGAGALAASDRDVAYWIAEANSHYDICAARLNALVDFEMLE